MVPFPAGVVGVGLWLARLGPRMTRGLGLAVAAAQEIQKERDAKTDKQGLYYAEWERLEAVMAEAEEILAVEAAGA